MSVELDVARDVMAQLDRERVALARRGDPNGVSHADAIDAHPGDRRVHPKEVAFGRAEAVLAREAHLFSVVADERDDLPRVGDDLVDGLPVTEFAQDR